jgi:hypothetical protein
MRRSAVATIGAITLAAGMLGACGNQHAPGATDSSPSTSAGGPVSDQTLTSDISYYRSGGIAGFHDRLRLSPDGVATLERGGKTVVRCRVRPAPLHQIAQSAAAARAATPPATPGHGKLTPKNPAPDRITITVTVGDHTSTGAAIDNGDNQAWQSLYQTMGKLFAQTLALQPGNTAKAPQPPMCDKI